MLLRFWPQIFCKHLLEEIEWLKEQVLHERQRAELAIDELLRFRSVSPVSVPQVKESSLIEKMINSSEFASVGESE